MISVRAAGGTEPYRYSLTGVQIDAPTGSFGKLAGGTYALLITDAKGCTQSLEVVVKVSGVINVALVEAGEPTCGEDNGSLRVQASGGVAPYTYLWQDGAKGAERGKLAAGTYVVEATDARGCATLDTFTLNNGGELDFEVVAAAADTCGRGTGGFKLDITKGSAPYTFTLNGVTVKALPKQVAAGRYDIGVVDAKGCRQNKSVVIQEVGSFLASLQDYSFCESGGTIAPTIDPSIEVAYLWSTGEKSASITVKTSGTYSVRITNRFGCTVDLTTTVEVFDATAALPGIRYEAPCFGATDGRLTLTSNSNRDSLYSIDGGQSYQASPVFASVAPGAYDLVTLFRGECKAGRALSLEALPALALTSTDTVTGLCSVVLTVQASGGDGGPYTYFVNGEDRGSSGTLTLAPGTSRVVARDAKGCASAVAEYVFDTSGGLGFVAEVSYPSCVVARGDVLLRSGSAGAVTVSWSDGGTGLSRTGLSPGSYRATISNAEGCTQTVEVVVEEIGQIVASFAEAKSPTNCVSPNGILVVDAVGGLGPFRYSWTHDPNLTAARATGLASGAYRVVVMDVRGCTQTLEVVLDPPPSPRLVLTSRSSQTCAAPANGAVGLTLAQAPNGPVTAEWNGEPAPLSRSDLTGGRYRVTGTDSAGCTSTIDIILSADVLRFGEVEVRDASCDTLGGIALTDSGGQGCVSVRLGERSA